MKQKDQTSRPCELCKSFSGTGQLCGWCMKRRKSVKKGGTCAHWAESREKRYEQVCHPLNLFSGS